MKRSYKTLIRDIARSILTPKGYTYLRFWITHRYHPDLGNPKTFSEKLIARKFSSESIAYSKYVDKYIVREYVKETIGEDYLIPLISVHNKLYIETFDTLPNSFVIKTSHGGGGEHVLIVDDKSKLDLKLVCDRFNSLLNEKLGSKIDELFYDVEQPKIIIEKLIKHKSGSFPSDFKLHVFNGLNKVVIIQVDSDRFDNHKRSLFSENLERLKFKINLSYEPIDDGFEFPHNFNEVICCAKTLSDRFDYVRVDMYNVDGKVYFGELTFCHGSGWETLESKDIDFLLGSYWNYHEK